MSSPTRRTPSTVPQIQRDADQNIDLFIQSGTQYLRELEESSSELDTLTEDFSTTTRLLQSDASREYERAREAIRNRQRAERVPTGIANLLSFLGDDTYNRDLQQLNIEEASLNLQQINQNLQTTLTLRNERAALVERQVSQAATRFGLIGEVIGAQRSANAEARSEAFLAISLQQESRAQMQEIINTRIPALSDEALDQAVTNTPEEFQQFRGFLQQEQQRRQAAGISLRSAEVSLAGQQIDLAQFHREQFLTTAPKATLQQLLSHAEGGRVTTPAGLQFTTRELQNAITLSEAEQSAALEQNINTAKVQMEIETGLSGTLNNLDAYATVVGPSLPLNIQRSVDRWTGLLNDDGTLKDSTDPATYFASIRQMQEEVDQEIETFTETYSGDKTAQGAVESYLTRGGTFANVTQSNSVLGTVVDNPRRLSGTSLANSYSIFSDNYQQIVANNFETTFSIGEEEEGLTIPANRKITREEAVARALNEPAEIQDSDGSTIEITPYQQAVSDITYEYGVGVMLTLANENSDLWGKFVTGENFVTTSGNPSFRALWQELSQADHARRVAANMKGVDVVASLTDMYRTALIDQRALSVFLTQMHENSSMEARAMFNSLGITGPAGINNQTLAIFGEQSHIIAEQGANVRVIISENKQLENVLGSTPGFPLTPALRDRINR